MVRQSQTLLKKYSLPVSEIEVRSFQIIRKLLPAFSVTNNELQVVVRIVHTCGDPEVARLVRFHPRGIVAAVDALRRGRAIFTDVRMVAVGIKRHLAESLGCTVRCALDALTGRQNDVKDMTQTALAMDGLGHELDDTIVAIGNAPTALLALLDIVDEGRAAPAVIIGMPVGFVAAVEAKQELARRDIPFITIEGTRGGSAVAAATVNALMLLAQHADKEVMRDLL